MKYIAAVMEDASIALDYRMYACELKDSDIISVHSALRCNELD